MPRRYSKSCGSRSATSVSPTARCKEELAARDANINLHIDVDGKTVATPIVEIKNLNSFRSVERALAYEAERQFRQWKEDGLTIHDIQGDPGLEQGPTARPSPNVARRPRPTTATSPKPDLVPVVVDEPWIERIRASIGELPARRRQRFETDYGLSAYDANVLVEQGQDVADYFDAVAKATGESKLASNWIQQDVLQNHQGEEADSRRVRCHTRRAGRPDQPGETEAAQHEPRARGADGLVETGDSVDKVIAAGGYGMVSDRDAIAAAVEAALAVQPQGRRGSQRGKKKPDAVKGFLRGQVMKQTGGKADPALIGELLDIKLAELASQG